MRHISKHSSPALPDGAEEILFIDLQKDKKTAIVVNGLSVICMLAMILVMNRHVPVASLFDFSSGLGMYFLRLGFLLGGCIVYIILHELTHAAVMKVFGGQKINFGFTGLYAYAGSTEDYFDKCSYICIALAPLVLYGVLFLVANLLVPPYWFWVVYALQIFNVCGSIGDIYVALRFAFLPRSIWIRDTGVNMTVYN